MGNPGVVHQHVHRRQSFHDLRHGFGVRRVAADRPGAGLGGQSRGGLAAVEIEKAHGIPGPGKGPDRRRADAPGAAGDQNVCHKQYLRVMEY